MGGKSLEFPQHIFILCALSSQSGDQLCRRANDTGDVRVVDGLILPIPFLSFQMSLQFQQEAQSKKKVARTNALRKMRGKEMAVDSTFEFWKIDSVEYDRDLMEKVHQIKESGEHQFLQNSTTDAKAAKKKQARVEIVKSIELLPPAVWQRERKLWGAMSIRTRSSTQRLILSGAGRSGVGEGYGADQMEE